jgi:predicted membrane channel-forming protein YqfA (hemolysin III family)
MGDIQMSILNSLSGFASVVVGVAVAVVLPLLFDKLRTYFPAVGGFKDNYAWVVRYLVLGGVSLAVGGILYSQWKSGHPGTALNPNDGFLLGFSGESAIEKAFRPKKRG